MLRKMGESGKAQQVYEILLEQATQEDEKIVFYHQLGRLKNDLGEYKEAITFYEKSIEIQRKVIPPNQHDLASSTLCLSQAYRQIGQDRKALLLSEEALQIY